LSGTLLPTSAPLHDFGSFVLSDNTLHLEQQIVFRTPPQRPVQEDQFDTGALPLINQ
jgi:hypothetical protein